MMESQWLFYPEMLRKQTSFTSRPPIIIWRKLSFPVISLSMHLTLYPCELPLSRSQYVLTSLPDSIH